MLAINVFFFNFIVVVDMYFMTYFVNNANTIASMEQIENEKKNENKK